MRTVSGILHSSIGQGWRVSATEGFLDCPMSKIRRGGPSAFFFPVDPTMLSSGTRPPVDEKGEEIGRTNGSVAVEVAGAERMANVPPAQSSSTRERDHPDEIGTTPLPSLDALMPRHFCLDSGLDRCIFDASVREGRRGNDAWCGLKLVAVLAAKEHRKGADR